MTSVNEVRTVLAAEGFVFGFSTGYMHIRTTDQSSAFDRRAMGCGIFLDSAVFSCRNRTAEIISRRRRLKFAPAQSQLELCKT